MTLNGVVAVTLRYYAECVSFQCQLFKLLQEMR